MDLGTVRTNCCVNQNLGEYVSLKKGLNLFPSNLGMASADLNDLISNRIEARETTGILTAIKFGNGLNSIHEFPLDLPNIYLPQCP